METDREVLELCKEWFEDIMEKCDRLTTGNVSHNGRAIHGYAKNCAEYIESHLKDGFCPQKQWKPSDAQMNALAWQIKNTSNCIWQYNETKSLYNNLKKLKEE